MTAERAPAGIDRDEAVAELEQVTGITDDHTRAFLELTTDCSTPSDGPIDSAMNRNRLRPMP